MVETKCARGLQSWWFSLVFGKCGILVEIFKKKEGSYKSLKRVALMQNRWVKCDSLPPADVILNGRPRSGRQRRIQSDMCRGATLLVNIPNK